MGWILDFGYWVWVDGSRVWALGWSWVSVTLWVWVWIWVWVKMRVWAWVWGGCWAWVSGWLFGLTVVDQGLTELFLAVMASTAVGGGQQLPPAAHSTAGELPTTEIDIVLGTTGTSFKSTPSSSSHPNSDRSETEAIILATENGVRLQLNSSEHQAITDLPSLICHHLLILLRDLLKPSSCSQSQVTMSSRLQLAFMATRELQSCWSS
ncbi:hypothetical protein WN944_005646 [Citrus x changshan-huyou]|uniref:Uncharacterized protein n=1 Tax=Citrus x changshan-huyou TaxID=2935761 RepID=A0AAP0QSE6_9ROSI